jgi:hypothetical protein
LQVSLRARGNIHENDQHGADLRRFVLGWKKLGLEQRLGSRIVTYADDLVILCKKGKADEALQKLRKIMSKLKLTVNEEKTRICKVPEGEFDFLGYSVLQRHKERRAKAVINPRDGEVDPCLPPPDCLFAQPVALHKLLLN